MSPIFAYVLALMAWLTFACVVWFVAGMLSLMRRARFLAWPLCLAMAGTFPFVFAYQIVAAPFVVAIMLVAWAFGKILEPGSSTPTQNPLLITVSIAMAFLSLGVMVAMSIAGFHEGWRFGWACGKGRPWREVIWEGEAAALLRRVLPARHKKSAENV
jgi:hypothetical protein